MSANIKDGPAPEDGRQTPSLEYVCVAPNDLMRRAMECLDRNAKGIVLVVDDDQRLMGTITDGDIRRAILAGKSVDSAVSELLFTKKKDGPHAQPVTADADTSHEELLQIMQDHVVYQVPLLNQAGQVVGLVTMDELLSERLLPVRAVIMAGGFGTRLYPLTEDLPKPMLPVGGQPLIQRIIEQLQRSGVRRITITTHYHADKITSYFGDGKKFGVDINYVREEQPLGTAGAMSLLPAPTEPLLVMNGDILTQVDFRAMFTYHQEYDAALTVGVRTYESRVPYGVIRSDGNRVLKVEEKPLLRFFVNAGIYLMSPHAHRHIPHNCRFDMTDLIMTLIKEKQMVVSFPILEYWLDIGQHVDYEQAQEDFKVGRFAA